MKDNKYNSTTNSAKFNKRIELHGPTITQDDIGNEIETFGKLHDLWSMVKTVKASEAVNAGQEVNVYVVRFVVRYSKALELTVNQHRTKLVVKYKDAFYDVQSVINDDEANQTFTLVAEVRR